MNERKRAEWIGNPHNQPFLKPQSFVVFVHPTPQRSLGEDTYPPLAFRTSFLAGEAAGEVFYSERSLLTASADGQRFVLLVGRIYRPPSVEIGQTLLALYEQRGTAFVRDLNGSFALLLVDQAAGEIVFATDRLNTIKLLSSQWRERLIVSNTMALHPVETVQVDSVAVASYLVNGHTTNERTVLAQIQTLESGSIYRVRRGKLIGESYWRYAPTLAPPPTDTAAPLKAALAEAIIDAVSLRVRHDRATYLSLTAGNDSRAILGVLAERLRLADVQTFSYAYGQPKPMTDEYEAAKLAGLRGYPHRVIPSFNGSIVDTITRSSMIGAGLADACDEVDAWAALGEGISSAQRPVLFVGDTIVPQFGMALNLVDDAVISARLADFSAARWLQPLIGPSRYRIWVESTQAEVARAVERAEPDTRSYRGLYNLYDVLRLKYWDSAKIFTWRDAFAGQFFEVASPLLDDGILELIMNAPVELRRGKRLYLDAVTALFPALFALPGARSSSYASFWPAVYRQQSSHVRTWVESRTSPLDDLIEPRVLIALLDRDLTGYTRLNHHGLRALKQVYVFMRAIHPRLTAFSGPSMFKPALPATQFLNRALVLRAFLQSVEARQTG